MKYIICDDSEEFVQHLKKCILEIEPGSGFVIYNSLSALRSDIGYVADGCSAVFLDISLKDEDGIEGAKEIMLKYPCLKLVYIIGCGEGFSQSVLENPAQVMPVAFLTKPIRKKYLLNALEKIKQPVSETRFVTVRANRSIIPVPADKVLYISSDKRLLTLHTEDKGDISFYGKLSDMLDSDVFSQIHKSYAVNLRHIGTISGWKTVTLSDGTELPIGRAFSAGFRTDITGRSVNGGVLGYKQVF